MDSVLYAVRGQQCKQTPGPALLKEVKGQQEMLPAAEPQATGLANLAEGCVTENHQPSGSMDASAHVKATRQHSTTQRGAPWSSSDCILCPGNEDGKQE